MNQKKKVYFGPDPEQDSDEPTPDENFILEQIPPDVKPEIRGKGVKIQGPT
jgi:hypothetical protein